MKYDSAFFLRWRSLVKDRPDEYGKILCAIRRSDEKEGYWLAVCTYDPEQHRIFVPNGGEANFGDWIMSKDVHWSESPDFDSREIVNSGSDRKRTEEFLFRQADRMLGLAHDILLDIHLVREQAGETVSGDALTKAIADVGKAVDVLRRCGELPDYLAGWEREAGPPK